MNSIIKILTVFTVTLALSCVLVSVALGATRSQAVSKADSWSAANCGDFTHICVKSSDYGQPTYCQPTGVDKPNHSQWDCQGFIDSDYWPGGHIIGTEGFFFVNIGPADVVLSGHFDY